eukprot:240681-Hanusia_phi.AAC.2
MNCFSTSAGSARQRKKKGVFILPLQPDSTSMPTICRDNVRGGQGQGAGREGLHARPPLPRALHGRRGDDAGHGQGLHAAPGGPRPGGGAPGDAPHRRAVAAPGAVRADAAAQRGHAAQGVRLLADHPREDRGDPPRDVRVQGPGVLPRAQRQDRAQFPAGRVQVDAGLREGRAGDVPVQLTSNPPLPPPSFTLTVMSPLDRTMETTA